MRFIFIALYCLREFYKINIAMKFKVFIFSVFWTLLNVFSVCPATADDSVVTLDGNACETISGDETKSTARVRASDKAMFNAVSSLPLFHDYKSQLDSHDFNVMVYTVVDDYIEDLSIKTTEQTGEKICVNISGYINKTSALQAMENVLQNMAGEEEISDDTVTEATVELSGAITEHLEKEIPQKNTVAANNKDEKTVAAKSPVRGRVYVAPIEFFNNTNSPEHAKIITQWLENNGNFEITDTPDKADFTIVGKVLRAKVDALNNSSSRLQMVTSTELSFADGRKSRTVHQNRFVLFENSEDEQRTAYKLLQKLLDNSCEQLKAYMNNDNSLPGGGVLPSVVTPNGLSAEAAEEVL